jgi:hypothetical protein
MKKSQVYYYPCQLLPWLSSASFTEQLLSRDGHISQRFCLGSKVHVILYSLCFQTGNNVSEPTRETGIKLIPSKIRQESKRVISEVPRRRPLRVAALVVSFIHLPGQIHSQTVVLRT